MVKTSFVVWWLFDISIIPHWRFLYNCEVDLLPVLLASLLGFLIGNRLLNYFKGANCFEKQSSQQPEPYTVRYFHAYSNVNPCCL